MNENRSVFGIHGVTGMLIATALLLSILAFLTVKAIGAQQNNATTYYKIDEKKLQPISKENAQYYHIVKQ
ncbi:hypothetical protein MNB_SM-7-715 [hydrothermal vent metagenome]|uniref:Periplasmic protein n=1 Tax=hydrothermal vent metagenome TaxID=652676 RepID=A0A1W1C362_9ZZZZ